MHGALRAPPVFIYNAGVRTLLSPAVFSPLLAILLCVMLHKGILRFFPQWGLLDFPQRYGLKRAPLPYPSGIAAIMAFGTVFLLLEDYSMQNMGVIVAVALVGCASFIDDRRNLPPALRLGLQMLAALLLFATGTRIYTLSNPAALLWGPAFFKLDAVTVVFPPFGLLPVGAGIFTLCWLLLTTNALNWFDGIPGQVHVVSVIAFLTLGLLAMSDGVNQPDVAVLAFMLAGIAGASALFDLPPPRVVPGDSGSMFFGLMLGILSIYAGGKVATAFLVLGVPLIDSVLVILRRVLQGRSPFKGSLSGDHLHHRLMEKGWQPHSVLALTALLSTLFGLAALMLGSFGKLLIALLLTAVMLGLTWYSRPSDPHTPSARS